MKSGSVIIQDFFLIIFYFEADVILTFTILILAICKLHQYFYISQRPNCFFDLANTELIKISTWFKANKLSLNLKKTFLMVFKTRQRKRIIEGTFIIEDKQIEQVSQI